MYDGLGDVEMRVGYGVDKGGGIVGGRGYIGWLLYEDEGYLFEFVLMWRGGSGCGEDMNGGGRVWMVGVGLGMRLKKYVEGVGVWIVGGKMEGRRVLVVLVGVMDIEIGEGVG